MSQKDASIHIKMTTKQNAEASVTIVKEDEKICPDEEKLSRFYILRLVDPKSHPVFLVKPLTPQ